MFVFFCDVKHPLACTNVVRSRFGGLVDRGVDGVGRLSLSQTMPGPSKDIRTSSTALAGPRVEDLPGQIRVRRAHGALVVELRKKSLGCAGLAAFLAAVSGGLFLDPAFPNTLNILMLIGLGLGSTFALLYALHRPEIHVAHGRIRAVQRFLPWPLKQAFALDIDSIAGVGTVQENLRTEDPAKPHVVHRLFFRKRDQEDVEVPLLAMTERESAVRVVEILAAHLGVSTVTNVHHRKGYQKAQPPVKVIDADPATDDADALVATKSD